MDINMQLKRQKLHYKDNLKQIQDNVFKSSALQNVFVFSLHSVKKSIEINSF